MDENLKNSNEAVGSIKGSLKDILNNFYKGFVELNKNTKKSIDKYKDGEKLKTYEEAKDLNSYGGVLNERSVLIDIDNMEESEKLLSIVKDLNINCRVTKTTRGRHFTFYNQELKPITNCKHDILLALGLHADIKSGYKNTYEVLKIGGEERFVEREIDVSAPISTVPSFLLPITIRANADFLALKEGDGRNQALFDYILTLQANAFRKEEIKETLTIINNYILKERLSDQELSQIMRDDAFKKPAFFIKGVFLFDVFSKYIVAENNIKRINGALHVYADGIYRRGNKEIEYQMIQHISLLNRSKRAEVLSYLDLLCRKEEEPAKAGFIAFQNGIYSIYDDTLSSFDPSIVVLNKIPWDYNPNAYSKIVDEALDNLACGKKETRILLEEMIGYTMFARNEIGRCFFLIGEGNNGKSTLIKMLKNMLGKENISVLDISKLDDRFSTIMMYNKLANLGDDISSNYIKDTSTLKKIVTGDPITCEEKGQPVFDFEPHCKLIFSANVVPRLGNGRDTYALARRLIFIPLDAQFKKEKTSTNDYDKNAFKIDELESEESMEYLINIGIKALKRVVKNQDFTLNSLTINELKRFEKDNNPVLGFFEEVERIDDLTTDEVYSQYVIYCKDNGINALSKNWFIRELLRKFREFEVVIKRVDGKRVKFFEKVGSGIGEKVDDSIGEKVETEAITTNDSDSVVESTKKEE